MDPRYRYRIDVIYYGLRGTRLRMTSVFADPDLLDNIRDFAVPGRKNGRVKVVMAIVYVFHKSAYWPTYHYEWLR